MAKKDNCPPSNPPELKKLDLPVLLWHLKNVKSIFQEAFEIDETQSAEFMKK